MTVRDLFLADGSLRPFSSHSCTWGRYYVLHTPFCSVIVQTYTRRDFQCLFVFNKDRLLWSIFSLQVKNSLVFELEPFRQTDCETFIAISLCWLCYLPSYHLFRNTLLWVPFQALTVPVSQMLLQGKNLD